MAVAFKSEGDSVEFVAPAGGVTLNTPVLISGLLVIPQVTAAAAANFTGKVSGAFTGAAKATGAAWSEGDVLYWDDGNSRFTTTRSTFPPCAVALDDATSGAATGNVLLNQYSGEAFQDYVAALAAVTTNNGASLIGVEDSAGYLTATDAEAAIAELASAMLHIDLTAAAESCNNIDVTVNVETLGDVALSQAVSCIAELHDAAMLEATAANFTIAETGAGTEISTTAKPRLFFATDASGDATLRVNDVMGASGATIYLTVTPTGRDGTDVAYSVAPNTIALTFD